MLREPVIIIDTMMAISNEMGEDVDGDCVDVDGDGDDCENEDATNMRPRDYHCRVRLAEWHCYSPVVSTSAILVSSLWSDTATRLRGVE